MKKLGEIDITEGCFADGCAKASVVVDRCNEAADAVRAFITIYRPYPVVGVEVDEVF